jgi:hypothetical protein
MSVGKRKISLIEEEGIIFVGQMADDSLHKPMKNNSNGSVLEFHLLKLARIIVSIRMVEPLPTKKSNRIQI